MFSKIRKWWKERHAEQPKTVEIVHDSWTKEIDDGFVVRCEHCGREELVGNKHFNQRLAVDKDNLTMTWRCNDCGHTRLMFTLVGENKEFGIGVWEMETPSGKVVQGMMMLEEFER